MLQDLPVVRHYSKVVCVWLIKGALHQFFICTQRSFFTYHEEYNSDCENSCLASTVALKGHFRYFDTVLGVKQVTAPSCIIGNVGCSFLELYSFTPEGQWLSRHFVFSNRNYLIPHLSIA